MHGYMPNIGNMSGPQPQRAVMHSGRDNQTMGYKALSAHRRPRAQHTEHTHIPTHTHTPARIHTPRQYREDQHRRNKISTSRTKHSEPTNLRLRNGKHRPEHRVGAIATHSIPKRRMATQHRATPGNNIQADKRRVVLRPSMGTGLIQ